MRRGKSAEGPEINRCVWSLLIKSCGIRWNINQRKSTVMKQLEVSKISCKLLQICVTRWALNKIRWDVTADCLSLISFTHYSTCNNTIFTCYLLSGALFYFFTGIYFQLTHTISINSISSFHNINEEPQQQAIVHQSLAVTHAKLTRVCWGGF